MTKVTPPELGLGLAQFLPHTMHESVVSSDSFSRVNHEDRSQSPFLAC